MADVPFDDQPQKKKRPVVILESDQGKLLVQCLKMTLKFHGRGEYKVKEWQYAGLNIQTYVIVDRILILNRVDVIHYIGSLHPADILALMRKTGK